jgi:hypothetical protein
MLHDTDRMSSHSQERANCTRSSSHFVKHNSPCHSTEPDLREMYIPSAHLSTNYVSVSIKQQINKLRNVRRPQPFWCSRCYYPYKFIPHLSKALRVYHARLCLNCFRSQFVPHRDQRVSVICRSSTVSSVSVPTSSRTVCLSCYL